MKQVTIDYAIAFRIKDTIYLNKNLDKYPELKNNIIKHELEHTNSLKMKDIKLDLFGKYLKSVKKDYYKFLFTEKRAFYQFLPLLKVNNKWYFDGFLTFFYLIILVEIFILINIMTEIL